jgi:hypothetical protein
MPFDEPTFHLIVKILAGLGLAWVCLPMVLGLLGLSRVRVVGEQGPSLAEPGDDDPAYAALAAELTALGFRPRGLKTETAWCVGPSLKKSWVSRVFATPQDDCFATVFRLVPDEPYRLCFSTVFTDGALVQSANQLGVLKIEFEDYLRWGDATIGRAELLRMHREVCAQFAAAGGRTVARASLAAFVEANQRLSAKVMSRKFSYLPMLCLGHALGLLMPLPIIVGLLFGFDHWAAPLALAVSVVMHEAVMPFVFRRTAAQMRREEKGDEPAPQQGRPEMQPPG